MKTDQEIIARIDARRPGDPLAFEWPYYLSCLPFDLAKPYLNHNALERGAEAWKINPRDTESMRLECLGYMAFAWEKANNFRGISAQRSISHFIAWLWLMGEPWCDTLMDDYEFYGKPQLVRICEFLSVDPKQWDDGVRLNEEP